MFVSYLQGRTAPIRTSFNRRNSAIGPRRAERLAERRFEPTRKSARGCRTTQSPKLQSARAGRLRRRGGRRELTRAAGQCSYRICRAELHRYGLLSIVGILLSARAGRSGWRSGGSSRQGNPQGAAEQRNRRNYNRPATGGFAAGGAARAEKKRLLAVRFCSASRSPARRRPSPTRRS